MLCYFMLAANLATVRKFFNVTQGSYFFSWFNGRSHTKNFTATYSTLTKLNKDLKALLGGMGYNLFLKTFTEFDIIIYKWHLAFKGLQ